MDELVDEYLHLAMNVKAGGLVIFNGDNNRLNEIAGKVSGQKISFGLSEDAECRILEVKRGVGAQTALLKYNGEPKEYSINRPGLHHIYAKIASMIIISRLKIS